MAVFDSKVVLSGVGQSELGRILPQSGLNLTVRACLAAIADAGLSVDDVDGIITYPGSYERQEGYAGAGAGEVISAMGLKVNFYLGSGEIPGQMGAIVAAALAVASGACNHVICFRTVKQGSAAKAAKGHAAVLPMKPKTSHWSEWALPFGLRVVSTTALQANRYMHAYGVTREQLAQVALTARRNAAVNPNAIYRAPLSLDDYLAAKIISTPFCLYDCDVPMDGSTAIVVSRKDALPKSARPHILLESYGSATQGEFWEDQADLFKSPDYASAAKMWNQTDLRPSDVQIAQVYDGFSFQALSWLDALGLCERGGVGKFVEGGERIARDGALPMNTQGGQLSGGRLHGMGFLHECCVQLRGEAGDRQTPNNPRVGVVTTGYGWFASCLLLKLAS